jgi:hypothetical protein
VEFHQELAEEEYEKLRQGKVPKKAVAEQEGTTCQQATQKASNTEESNNPEENREETHDKQTTENTKTFSSRDVSYLKSLLLKTPKDRVDIDIDINIFIYPDIVYRHKIARHNL